MSESLQKKTGSTPPTVYGNCGKKGGKEKKD